MDYTEVGCIQGRVGSSDNAIALKDEVAGTQTKVAAWFKKFLVNSDTGRPSQRHLRITISEGFPELTEKMIRSGMPDVAESPVEGEWREVGRVRA